MRAEAAVVEREREGERGVCVCVHISESMTSLRAKEVRLTESESFRLLRRLCGESQRSICWRFRTQLRCLGTVPN